MVTTLFAHATRRNAAKCCGYLAILEGHQANTGPGQEMNEAGFAPPPPFWPKGGVGGHKWRPYDMRPHEDPLDAATRPLVAAPPEPPTPEPTAQPTLFPTYAPTTAAARAAGGAAARGGGGARGVRGACGRLGFGLRGGLRGRGLCGNHISGAPRIVVPVDCVCSMAWRCTKVSPMIT